MGFDDKGKEGAAPDAPETHHEGSGDERGTALSRHTSEGSIPAPTEDEEEDVERKIDLGPQCTLKEQLEKDKVHISYMQFFHFLSLCTFQNKHFHIIHAFSP